MHASSHRLVLFCWFSLIPKAPKPHSNSAANTKKGKKKKKKESRGSCSKSDDKAPASIEVVDLLSVSEDEIVVLDVCSPPNKASAASASTHLVPPKKKAPRFVLAGPCLCLTFLISSIDAAHTHRCLLILLIFSNITS